ncbi:MAG: hypothetical protein ACFFD4_34520 [Candidatus Odinarchaeota archaeon]
MLKISENGQKKWEKSFGEKDQTDIGFDLVQASDGDLVIAGVTGSYGAGMGDMWLIKTADARPTPGLEVLPLLFAVPVLVSWHGWKKRFASRQKKE